MLSGRQELLSTLSIVKQISKSNIHNQEGNLAVSQLKQLHTNTNSSIKKQHKQNLSAYKKPTNQLKWINKSRQSTPYRLQIKRITNLGSVQKKSNSSNLYLNFTVKVFLKRKKNDSNFHQVQQLGDICQYQCEQSLDRKDQSKYQFPTCFYYHSKVSKNQDVAFLAISISVIELRSGIVENKHNMGFYIVQNPFAQTSQQLTLCKQQLSQTQYVEYDSYQHMAKNSQGPKVQIQIISSIQLKKLTKLIPENVVVSPDYQIVGLSDEYLQNDHQITQVVETSTLNLKIKYLQVHVPQNFQDQIVKSIRSFPNNLIGQKDEVKSRKVIISYLVGNYPINPIEKKLQLIDRQQAGDLRIFIYQGIKDGEILNYPYYLEDELYPISMSLVYQIGDKQFQVAIFTFPPITNGQTHQISQQMSTSPSDTLAISRPYFLKTSAKNKPTIITQYTSEEILMQDESIIASMDNNNKFSLRNMRSSQNLMRTSQRIVQDKAQQQRQKQKLMQEIEYQKISLQKERQQIQRIKNQNYVLYRQEFQKRFEQEKQALNRRQQMLQRQYRQQVERQIRQKLQLQDQIREMKEKVKRIEEQTGGMKRNEYYSDEGINPGASNEYMNSNQQGMSPFPFGSPVYPNRSPYNQSYNQRDTPPFQFKQKIDPGYLLEAQNSIPVTKVRQIIQQKTKSSLNKELIELSNSQFNRSSVFKFTFTSVSWNAQTTKPKEMYFIIRFFNFSQYKTDRVTTFGQNSQSAHQQLVRLHQHHYGNQDPTPTYTFIVDPSEYRNPKLLQNDLTSYLAHNSCIVDIFDGKTHIYLGQINIKLTELIKGNKIQTFIAKEYNLINIKTKQQFGSMQILVKNEESSCKNQLFALKSHTTSKQDKRKVISYAPMNVPITEKPLNSLNSFQKIKQSTQKNQTSKNRLQQRINQFKQRQKEKKLQDNSANFFTLPEKDKSNVLARIAHHKQKNMNEYIKNVYSTLLHENITINAQFGKAETFPYTFVNQGTSSSVYKIVIDENGSQNQDSYEPDLEVVKDGGQWRYLVKRNGYMEPKHYEIINSNNVFHLNAGQSLTMVFRYLTFGSVSQFSKSQERRINVSIVKIDSNWIAGGFSLAVQLHEQIVHHSYVLFEPGNSMVELVMPVIYTRQEEYGPGSIKKLYITDNSEDTEAHWLNEYQILLKMVTPEIMTKKTFHILLYDDEYFNQLKQNWVISVYSYEGVYTQSRPDFTTKLKVTLPLNSIPFSGPQFSPSLINNYLLLNSSDLSLNILTPKILPEFNKLKQNTAIQIWCQLIPSNNTTKQIVITCTQQQSSALVYAWILHVLPSSAKRQ